MIHLLTVADSRQLDRLPQFVEHYLGEGVERFCITLHIDRDAPVEHARAASERAEEVLAGFGVPLFAVLRCRFDAYRVSEQDNAVRRSLAPDDWVVCADLDELHEYPEPLREMLETCDELGYTEVRGKMIDRIAEDGSLRRFDPERPLWEQYPVGAPITGRILRGEVAKVVATRSVMRIGPGRHLSQGRSLRPYPKEAIVHHFKWDASVVERLRPRLSEEFKSRCPWWTETQRLVDHLERFGRIELSLIPHAEPGWPERLRRDGAAYRGGSGGSPPRT